MKLGVWLGVLCLGLAASSVACSSDDDDDAASGGASGSGGKGSGGGSGGDPGSSGSGGGTAGSAGAGGSGGSSGAGGGSSGSSGAGGMAGGGSCCTGTQVEWGPNGGYVAFTDQHRLSPCDGYVRNRTPNGAPPTLTCQQTLGGCGATVSGADVAAALEHADVARALAEAPVLYGCDSRPVDGQVLQIQIGAAVIEVGNEGCGGIPSGVQALADLLRALQDEQVMRGQCAEAFGT